MEDRNKVRIKSTQLSVYLHRSAAKRIMVARIQYVDNRLICDS